MIFYVVSKKVMISAGEASGELYGAMLSREVKKLWPDIQIFGIGGPQMESEGVDLIARISGVIGFTEAVRHLGEIRRIFKKAKEALINKKPDILILIDYPDFNMALAKKAKAAKIPILYYVSPQVWAWRSGRVKKLASLVNKVAVIFPFEVECYKGSGLQCEFVGHPIAETINITKTKEELKRDLGIDPHKPVISLLPGSRPVELQRHLPLIREVAAKIHEELPGFQIVFPLAKGSELNEELMDYITIFKNRTKEAVACSEVIAVASGTVTLEAALLGAPMVVFYKLSPVTFYLVKLLVKNRFAALVNLLSGKEIVVELLQKDANPAGIFSELKRILKDRTYRNNMISNLNRIGETLKDKRPSVRVASMIGEIAGWNNAST
jgi:lipid-A-disaccharide synthase